ncbi:hypothetical protein ACEPPN_004036 [Leptodophora sp. 'Broadleaf-Isolate-01']
MNFLNKARKKAEEALREIQAQAQAQTQGIGQSHQQNTNQYNPHQYPQQNQQQFSPPPQFHQQQHYPPPPSQSSQPPYSQQGYPAPPSNQYSSPPPQAFRDVPPTSTPGQQYPPPPPQPNRDQVHQQSYRQPPQVQPASVPQAHGAQAPAPPPQVAAVAPSVRDVGRKCLAKEPVIPFHTKFYCFIPSIGVSGESFTICSNCFQVNVASYNLASNFMEFRTTNENLRITCDFSFPRVRNTWYSQCIPRNTVQPLMDFPCFTETLSPCDGSTISSPGPFWITKNQTIPDLAICQTCFELFLRLTPFEGQFENKTYAETRDWSCDLAQPFFKRCLIAELENTNPSFQDLASEFNLRFKMPPCSGVGQPISTLENEQSQSLIFTALGGKTGNLCFACFSDCLANTSLQDDFGGAALTAEQKTTVTCDLASGYSKSAMEIAIQRCDSEVWRTAVGMVGKVGVCFGRKGTTEEEWEKKVAEHGSLAQWWHVTNYPSIEICPSCYWLFVRLFKADSVFSPVTRPLRAGIVRICFLAVSATALDTPTKNPDLFENSLTWRGRRLRNAISTGSELGDFSLLLSEAASISQEPSPCGGNDRGFKSPSGRKWYGRISQNQASNDDCTIVMCEECWSRTVKGNRLQNEFSMDLTDAAYQNEGATGYMCQPYSNRARKELRDAAQQGDITSFARYWNTRAALQRKRDEWVLILQQQAIKMQMQNHQQSMNMMLKFNAQANALSRIGSAGIVEAAMSDPGVRYGNSQIGYDSYTRGRAEAEQEFRDAQNMDTGSGSSMSMAAQSQRFIQLAAIDEAAFKEYE